MVVGRIEDGRIEFTAPLPPEWEGLMVRVQPYTPDEESSDLGARLEALHVLGPMEFEAGERKAIQHALTNLNQFSRSQMQQLADGSP